VDKIPFSVYDFFAYLSSGTVLIITADYIWELNLLKNKDVSPVFGVALVVLAYVTGHVVAHFSSFLIEQIGVHRILKRPSALLFGEKPRLRLFKLIFPQFHRALPESTQQRVKQRAIAHGCTDTGEGLFLHAYAKATHDERIQKRLDEFRNQYGFARNMSFAFLISALAIFLAHWFGHHAVHIRWALLAAFGGITLLYRYLKFFRQFSYELFLRYAELPSAEIKSTAAGV
jgi:hypothetical protein